MLGRPVLLWLAVPQVRGKNFLPEGNRWHPTEGSSSTGRAPVSKTGGWGFESLLPCPGVVVLTRVM
jgi:hypothetical protein